MVEVVDRSEFTDDNNVTVNVTVNDINGRGVGLVDVRMKNRGTPSHDLTRSVGEDGKIKYIVNTGTGSANRQIVSLPNFGVERDLGENNSGTFDVEFNIDYSPDISAELLNDNINRRCFGVNYSPGISITNSNYVPTAVRAIITTSSGQRVVSDEMSVYPGDGISNLPTPSLVADEVNGTFTVTIQSDYTGEWVDETTLTGEVNALTPELSLGEPDIPSFACPGQTVEVGVPVFNDGKCDGEAIVNFGDFATKKVSIEEGDFQRSEKFVNVSVKMPAEPLDVDIELENGVTGDIVDRFSGTVDTDLPSFKLENFSIEEVACPGNTVSTSVPITNEANCGGDVTVSVSGIGSETLSIEGGQTESVNVSANVPPSGVTLSITLNNDLTGEIDDRFSKSITVGKPQFSFGSFNVPDEVCPGERVTANVPVVNSGTCPGKATIQADSIDNKSITLDPGEKSSIEIDIDVPLDGLNLNLTILNERTGEANDSVTEVINTGGPSFNIDRLEAPDTSCVGGSVDYQLYLTNTGSCTGKAIIGSNTVSDVTATIDSGETKQLSFTRTMSDTDINTEFVVRNARTQSADGRIAKTTTVGSPSFAVQNINAPDVVCPGADVEYTVSITNNGDCRGEVVVSSNNTRDVSATIEPGGSTSLSFVVQASTSNINTEFTLTNNENGSVDDRVTSVVDVGQPEFDIEKLSLPETACSGTLINYDVEVTNNGSCPGEAIVGGSDVGETVVPLDVGETKVTSLSRDMPRDDVKAQITVTNSQTGEVDDEVSGVIIAERPSFSIDSLELPDLSCEGNSIEYNLSITNTGECVGEAIVSSSGAGEKVTDIEPGQTRSISLSRYMTRDDLNAEVMVTNGFTGDMDDKVSDVITAGRPSFTIQDFELPEISCQGSVVEYSVSILNRGDCLGEAIIDGTGVDKKVADIKPDETKTLTFSREVPSDGLSPEIILTNGFTETVEDRVSGVVTAGKPSFNIERFNIPERSCEGNEIEYNISVSNNGDCPGQAILDGSGIGENVIEINPNETREVSLTRIMSADDLEAEITVSNGVTGGTDDKVRDIIEVEKPSFEIGDIGLPDRICRGKNLEYNVPVSNVGECFGEATVGGPNIEGEVVGIEPGSDAVVTITREVPGSDFNAEVAVTNSKTGEVDSRVSKVVEVIQPDFSIDDISLPDTAQAGNIIDVSYTISNASDCAGEVLINSTDLGEQSIAVDANGKEELTQSVRMPGDGLDFGVELKNQLTEDVDDKFVSSVRLERTIVLDNSDKNSITMYGGFSSDVEYLSLIVGSNLGQENVEERENLLGDEVARFNGILRTGQISQTDKITFDGIKYASIELDKPVPFVKNGKVQGESDSIEFNNTRLPSSVFNIDDREHDLSIGFSLANRRDVLGRIKSFGNTPTLSMVLSDEY